MASYHQLVELSELYKLIEQGVKTGRLSCGAIRETLIELNKGDPARIIDCDAEPLCSDGMKVDKHQGGGKMTRDDLHKQLLEGRVVMNATVLDYLLTDPQLIPDSWKRDVIGRSREIFFPKTVYLGSDGLHYIRILHFSGREWCSSRGLESAVLDMMRFESTEVWG